MELETAISSQSTEENTILTGDIEELVEKLDFLDIQLLRKFYMNGKEQPFDSQPYCFPLLYREMKTNHKMKIGYEALRKRLDVLVRTGLIVKINHSNPTNYAPISDRSVFVKCMINKFFLINGLEQFL